MSCAAAAMGSTDSCGRAAWPPRPWTVTRSMSQLAVNTPGRTPTVPARRVGIDVQRDNRVDVLRAPRRRSSPRRRRPFPRPAGKCPPRHGPGQLAGALQRIERRDRAEDRGRVDVVAAGVHHLRHLAVIRDRLLVLNPQRVAIGPHGDSLAWSPASGCRRPRRNLRAPSAPAGPRLANSWYRCRLVCNSSPLGSGCMCRCRRRPTISPTLRSIAASSCCLPRCGHASRQIPGSPIPAARRPRGLGPGTPPRPRGRGRRSRASSR